MLFHRILEIILHGVVNDLSATELLNYLGHSSVINFTFIKCLTIEF